MIRIIFIISALISFSCFAIEKKDIEELAKKHTIMISGYEKIDNGKIKINGNFKLWKNFGLFTEELKKNEKISNLTLEMDKSKRKSFVIIFETKN